ncbi:hypothetical protein KI688_005084 [Linnemannia hyalina]|uniref:Uncharacterized protein n=1 Tax=Linnemannia hyalina TaxID=64524 RepID=A0A9P7XLM9_9FUNG|nr:hypothetical protein KI688_005084 [Linnemannia hyalina]
MRAPDDNVVIPINRPSFSASTVDQGNDVQDVLSQIASRLNQGLPDRWERLTHAPISQGSSSIDMIASSDLESIIRSWGLDNDMFDQAYRDINTLIRLAVGEGVYIAQGFSNLDTQELQDVQAVMSTFQSNWALELLSQQLHQAQPTLYSAKPGTSLFSASDDAPVWPGLFDRLLRLFIGNSAENRDVHKVYRGGLLEAIQNATLSRRQGFHNMQLTVSERGIVPLLEDMLSSCFDRAGIEESVEEWWRRVYTEDQGDPISLECEFASQRRVSIVPPRDRCITSTNVTIDNSYSWILVAPHDNGLFDILFMEVDLGMAFEGCEPEEEDNDEEDLGSWTTPVRIPMAIQESGSMIRWGYVDSNDGSFGSVQYLAKWESYPSHVSKVLLDFLRFASAASYLKIPIYRKTLSPPSLSPSPCPHRHPIFHQHQRQQLRLQDASTGAVVAPLAMDPSFLALMESIKLFAETWEKLVKVIGSTTSTTIKRRVCLGFDTLDYKASSSVMQGVAHNNLAELVEEVVDLEELPRREDIKHLMTGINYSTNFTWLAESMTFTNPAGESSYFFFSKYGGDGSTGMANVVYSAVKSKFTLAPDMLIVRRQKSSWFGFRKSDETSIEYVPHTLTLNDTLVLEMFWEMVAFHQLAITLGGDPPMYPDLSGYCDRSIP